MLQAARISLQQFLIAEYKNEIVICMASLNVCAEVAYVWKIWL